MIIHKKRIRNITPYIRHITGGSKFFVGIIEPARFTVMLRRIGFPEPFSIGQSILPAGVGPVSMYNAEGKEVIRMDQPMEKVYHQRLHHWTEWHGPYRVEQSGIVDFPYKRYPRSYIEPPSVELTITKSNLGQLLLTSPVFEKTEDSKITLTHTVNLFLELFGECQFFTSNLETIIKTPVQRLNWTILPQGEMPWSQFQKSVESIVKRAPKSVQPVLYFRLKTVNELNPNFRAIGTGGFHGYIVHGFTDKNLYVLESMYYGNATYILGESWEDLSKKTKAEILNDNLQTARVIHRESWKKKVKEIIEGGERYAESLKSSSAVRMP